MNILPATLGKPWACQVRFDYIDNFDALTGLSGQIIFETTSAGDARHRSTLLRRPPRRPLRSPYLGDCNLIYRFAQHPRGQMRMGIGANWLTDPAQTDLGFNFYYGGDFFPLQSVGRIRRTGLGHPGPRRPVPLSRLNRPDIPRPGNLRRLRIQRHRIHARQFLRLRRARVVLKSCASIGAKIRHSRIRAFRIFVSGLSQPA